jgi:hypothetical protein
MRAPEPVRSALRQAALVMLLGCATDVELLPNRTRVDPGFSSLDAGSAPSPYPPIAPESGPTLGDAGDAVVDDASTRAGPVFMPPTRDIGAVLWTTCDANGGGLFDRARSGDGCTFPSVSCARDLPGCVRRTAFCGDDGTLYLGELSKSGCEPDPTAIPGRCTMVDSNVCCIQLWPCGRAPAAPTPAALFCALDCGALTVTFADAVRSSCEDARFAWPPLAGEACAGSFVCDTLGHQASADTAFDIEDSEPDASLPSATGFVYWCAFNRVQRIATGGTLPWNASVPTN